MNYEKFDKEDFIQKLQNDIKSLSPDKNIEILDLIVKYSSLVIKAPSNQKLQYFDLIIETLNSV